MADPGTIAPAHRPSRRQDIVDAAIRQFAHNGFVDTSISEIAADAGVVVTAIYYHFDGKEDLFSAAVTDAFASISEVVGVARDEYPAGDRETLRAVIDAVWHWIDEHPDEATLLYVQLPAVTRGGASRTAAFEDRHVNLAFGYFGIDDPGSLDAADRATVTLRARSLVHLCISVHTMRLADGPLSGHDADEVRAALHDAASRLVA